MKHFLSRNIEDQMNAFDGKKNSFLCKNLHPLKSKECFVNQSFNPDEGECLGKKICEKTS